ncbi:polysaccharide deacetylase family protein [Paenibacillus solisilvae]|uniref:Polysaccharide deacetylase family protein n=1 Tax=Paenibacillus solisilvae TaxID=2486751 RepID=A0ABW0W7G7_9BACL
MYPNGARFAVQLSFDLETVTNFPYWTSFWNHRKGAIDQATKVYVEQIINAKCEKYGAKAHYFLVGSMFEDPDIDYLKKTVAAGHAVGNHTYTHVSIKAQEISELAGVFTSAPWRGAGRSAQDAVRQEIQMTTAAIKNCLGVEPKGFRSPGGFQNGLQDTEYVQKMLQEEGFWWVSTHYNDGLFADHYRAGSVDSVYKVDVSTMISAFNKSEQILQPYQYECGLLELPLAGITDVVAWRGYGTDLGDWLRMLSAGVDYAHEHGLIFNLTTHPAVLASIDPFGQTIDVIMRRAMEKEGGVWLPDLEEVALHLKNSGSNRKPVNLENGSQSGSGIPIGKTYS